MVSIIVALIIVALALWAVQQIPIDGRLILFIQLLIVIAAILYFASYV